MNGEEQEREAAAFSSEESSKMHSSLSPHWSLTSQRGLPRTSNGCSWIRRVPPASSMMSRASFGPMVRKV